MAGAVLSHIRAELMRHVDEGYRRGVADFFKGVPVKFLGVRTPLVRGIAGRSFREIKDLDKTDIWSLGNRLLASGYSEERTIAFDWAWRLRRKLEPSDFAVFEKWLTRHCADWGGVDDLCCHALGCLLYEYPAHLPRLQPWARSNQWHLRRASAVALIYSVRRERQLDRVLKTADILLMDKEDLVQKGYGWMLKEATRCYPKIVFEYVLKHKARMPRTALRYAIEKLPEAWKKRAMVK